MQAHTHTHTHTHNACMQAHTYTHTRHICKHTYTHTHTQTHKATKALLKFPLISLWLHKKVNIPLAELWLKQQQTPQMKSLTHTDRGGTHNIAEMVLKQWRQSVMNFIFYIYFSIPIWHCSQENHSIIFDEDVSLVLVARSSLARTLGEGLRIQSLPVPFKNN